jgi:hypothetical protein
MYFFYILPSFYLIWCLTYINIPLNILSLLDYKIDSNILHLPSKLIVISSHTSIQDFIIGSLYYYAILYKRFDAYVLMKRQFEKICSPFLFLFSSKFKLISVDSTKSNNITQNLSKSLENKDNYMIFISPEGTRNKTDVIKSGYWHISKNLNIDILYIGIDFSLRTIILEPPRKPCQTLEDDKNEFIKCTKRYTPLYPERCFWYSSEET